MRFSAHYGSAHEHTHYRRDTNGTTQWIIDAKGALYTFRYDKLNRKTSETYPLDEYNVNRTDLYWYDEAGNLIQYKNPADQSKHLSYDVRNRQHHTYWDGGTGVGPDVVTNYDWASRMSDITTNSGETVVAFGYDD